jgi:hypothetical protein
MKIVFLNQYYPPDAAPTGVMLEAVVVELAAQGHEVTVLCAEGGYADVERRTLQGRDGFTHPSHLSPPARGENGPQTKHDDPAVSGRPSADKAGCLRKSDPAVVRIRATRFGRGTFAGKLLDYLSYYLGVAWRLWWMVPKPERVVALTTPPYLSVLARIFSKLRGADHAHWVMDVYPDVMVAHGMLREGCLRHRLLAALARWGFGGKRCAAVLTLGPDMAERVGEMVGTSLHRRPTCPQRGAEENEKNDPAFAGPASRDEVGRMRKSDPTEDEEPRSMGIDAHRAPLQAIQGRPVAAVCDRRSECGEEEVPRSMGIDAHPTSPRLRRTSRAPLQAIPLWSDDVGLVDDMALAKRRHEMGWADDEMIVMYSGNMGLGHRFGEILEVIGKRSEGRDGFTHPSHLSPTARDVTEMQGRQSEVGGQRSEVGGRRSEDGGRRSEDRVRRSGCGEEELPRSMGIDAHPTSPRLRRTGRAPLHSMQGRPSIRFVFFGGGKRRGEIAEFMAALPGCAVELHDYVPREQLALHLQSADLHLVSLEPSWTGTMLPSKLQGIFAAARPVVFIGDECSSIGRWVMQSGGGWVVAPGDVAGLQNAIDAARNPQVRESRGRAAAEFAASHFDRETNVRKVAGLLAG